jgi:magnesium transporter
VEERVALAFVTDHPLESARLLEQAPPTDAAALLERLPSELAAQVFEALAPAVAVACLAALPDKALSALLEALPLDAAGTALRGMEPARRERLLAALGAQRQEALNMVLSYGENTAGALADPLVLALPDDITVLEAQRLLRSSGQHLFYYVYVLARDRKLVGTLTLPELMAADPRAILNSIMQPHPTSLDARAELATLAVHPAWRDFDALPVVDAANKLIGAIRHRTIRRMGREPGAPMMATIVGLSELYWAGLSGILTSLVPPPTRTQEDDRVS